MNGFILPRAWRFAYMEARLLSALLGAEGTLTRDAALDALYGGVDEPHKRTLDVFVHRIRTKLLGLGFRGAVDTVRGQGYRLTPDAKAQIKAALAPSEPAQPAVSL